MASNSHDSVLPGTVLNFRWEIIKCIGKGSFSEIYVAQDSHHMDDFDRYVAVKLQTPDFASTVLQWESIVIQALADVPNAPKYISSGKYDNRDFLVMELLAGDDMAHLRNRIRNKSPSGLIPIPIASYLARQMLTGVQKLHEKGFIHRDIKPSNFVRRNSSSTQYCMIDFGLTKLYRKKDGTLQERRVKADFRGTTVYCSPFVHDGEDQCPRDDLCSIFHVFLDMVCGKLPWGEEARANNRDKAVVAKMKHHFYDYPDQFMQYQEKITQEAEYNKPIKGGTNFPIIAQVKCKEILAIIRDLKYEDIPDYERLEMLFYACVPTEYQSDVSSFQYHYEDIFLWKDGIEHANRLYDMLSRYNNSYNNTNNNTNTTSNPTTPRQLTTSTAMSPTLSSSTTTALTTTNYHHNNNNEHNGNGNNGNGNTVFRSSNIMMLSTGTGHRLPSTTTNTTNATNATAIATTTMITSNNNNNDPMQVKIKNLLTRVQSLQSPAAASSSSFITSASASASSSSSSAFHNIPIPMKTPTEIYSMARRWLYAYKELMELSEFKISLELVYAFYYVLIQTQFFFLIDLGEEPIDHIHPIHQTVQYPTRWEEFIALQEAIAQVCELYNRVLTRIRAEEVTTAATSTTASASAAVTTVAVAVKVEQGNEVITQMLEEDDIVLPMEVINDE